MASVCGIGWSLLFLPELSLPHFLNHPYQECRHHLQSQSPREREKEIRNEKRARDMLRPQGRSLATVLRESLVASFFTFPFCKTPPVAIQREVEATPNAPLTFWSIERIEVILRELRCAEKILRQTISLDWKSNLFMFKCVIGSMPLNLVSFSLLVVYKSILEYLPSLQNIRCSCFC